MRKQMLLAFLILLFVLLALVINIRLQLVKLALLSPGAVLLGEIGHADGLKLLVRIAIDLAIYSAASYGLAAFGVWMYEKVLGGRTIK